MAMDHLVDDILALYHLIRRASHPVHRAEITPEQYWLLRLLRSRTKERGEFAGAPSHCPPDSVPQTPAGGFAPCTPLVVQL